MPDNNKNIKSETKSAAPPFPGRPGGGHRGAHIMGPLVKPRNREDTIKRLGGYLVKEKTGLIAVFFLVTVATLLRLCGPYLLGLAVDKYLIPRDIGGLKNIILLLIAIYVLSSAFTWLQNYVMIGIAQKAIKRIRDELFVKLQTLPLRFFDREPRGVLMSRFTNDIENISNTLSQSIIQIISSLLSITGIIAIMLFINWQLALITMLTVPLVILTTRRLAFHTRKAYSKRQKELGSLNGFIEETITGQKVIKAYNRESEVIAKFNQGNEALKKSSVRAETLSGSMGPIMHMINRLGFAIVVCVGGLMTVKGLATVGVITTFVTYSRQFAQPLQQIAALYNSIQAALAGAERVFEVMDEESEDEESKKTAPLKRVGGNVEFENVNFGYLEDVPVLKNINLQAKAGQTIALVGPTGSGKTTIINLLTRFYDINSGTIRIDGKDIRSINRDNLRQRLGIVLQDTYLFSGTIKENIRYGRLDAGNEEIIQAAKTANADQFIRRLPQGYETLLTEEGNNLSQGQRQLLAISRAVLSDPDILILDEATSSVDTRTEILIQKAMLSIMKGRTTFVIAHRLRTIRNADLILVIHQGEIIERGHHQELLAQKGFYYELYTSQFKKAN